MSSLPVVLFYGAMLIVAGLFAFWRGHFTGWIQLPSLFEDLVLGGLSGLGIVVLSRISMRVEAIRKLAVEFSSLLAGLSRRQVILFALTSGIGEEALFRGALQPEIGLFFATLLFASLHIGPGLRFLWWTAFAFLVGGFFGWLALWRESIVAPVTAHILVNYLNLGHLAKLGREEGRGA